MDINRSGSQPSEKGPVKHFTGPIHFELLFRTDVWERPQLSKRDRSLATVAALIALNRPAQLRSHFARARENGVT